MNTLKTLLFIIWTLLFFNPSSFAQKIVVTNSSCRPNVCLNANQVSFGLENLTFDPNDGDPKRRFSSFWVTGDGNYLLFDGSQDALSMTPTYLYSAPGTYEAAAYLTGKYTNRIPPARAAQSLNIVNAGTTTSPSPFNGRLGKAGTGTQPVVDIFSNHEIRKKNLTTFVISWPADVNASGVYLFYNGYKNSGTGALQAFPTPALKYQRTDVPLYFNGRDATGRPLFDATKIREYSTGNLRSPGFIDGITFGSTFANSMPSKFSHFVYFPAESATQTNMPAKFTENRLFAVLWADSTFVPQDSFMNFMVMLTGPTPVSGNEQLNAALAQINSDLIASAPLGTVQQQQQQFVQAIDELQLQYLTTFDPNQLTVEDVKKLGADEYEVSFRLEMCNKGRGIVENEDVSLSFPSNFSNFTPVGFNPVSSTQTTNSWDFRVAMTILGVEVKPDGQHEESICESITFKAKTNCEGLRSLWKSDKATSVQSCVIFDGGTANVQPECHAATGIDSTAFGCLCCNACASNRGDGMDGSCWPLWLLLILVVLFAIWWVYRRNNN